MLKMSTGENPDHDCVNSQLEKVVPRFSLVVPMFNESTRIAATIDELSKSRFLTAECEIVFVDDGSSDNSAELAGRLASESELQSSKVIRLDRNRGKGFAVRKGAEIASGDFIVFVDADLSVGLTDIENAFHVLENGADLIYGSRHHPDSRLPRSQPLLRVVSGRFYNVFLRWMLLTSERDTQCGLKGFTSSAASTIFPASEVDGFGFDIEILAIAERLNMDIRSVPVSWSHVNDSRVKVVRHGVEMISSTLRLRFRIRSTVKTILRESETSSDAISPMSQNCISAMGRYEDDHWWFGAKRKILSSLSNSTVEPHQTGLDIGCGAGGTLKSMSADGGTAIGLDIDDDSLEMASRVGLPLVKADALSLPFRSRSVDVISAFDVVEHTPDDVQVLREIARVADPAGVIVIAVPAYTWAWSDHDIRLGHYRRYTRSRLLDSARRAGLEVERCTYFHCWLIPPALLVRKTPLSRLLGDKQEELSFVNPIVNRVLSLVSSLEIWIMKHVDIPFGLSILLVAKVPDRPVIDAPVDEV